MDRIAYALSWLIEHGLELLDRLMGFDPHQRF